MKGVIVARYSLRHKKRQERYGHMIKVSAILSLLAFLLWSPLVWAVPSDLLKGDMSVFTTDGPRVDTDKIVFTDQAGTELSLKDFQGKVVVLNLWATWCAPCRKEMPDLDALHEKLAPEGLVVLAINEDRTGQDRAIAFLEEIGTTNLVFYRDKDRATMQALGVRGLPATYVFDRDGQQVGRLMGPAHWADEDAIELMRYILEQ